MGEPYEAIVSRTLVFKEKTFDSAGFSGKGTLISASAVAQASATAGVIVSL